MKLSVIVPAYNEEAVLPTTLPREGIFMGEDIDFYWRMRRYARRHGGNVKVLSEPNVVTSGRRFNKMNLWRVLVLTHPAFIRLTWRKKRWWKDWYDHALR